MIIIDGPGLHVNPCQRARTPRTGNKLFQCIQIVGFTRPSHSQVRRHIVSFKDADVREAQCKRQFLSFPIMSESVHYKYVQLHELKMTGSCRKGIQYSIFPAWHRKYTIPRKGFRQLLIGHINNRYKLFRLYSFSKLSDGGCHRDGRVHMNIVSSPFTLLSIGMRICTALSVRERDTRLERCCNLNSPCKTPQ